MLDGMAARSLVIFSLDLRDDFRNVVEVRPERLALYRLDRVSLSLICEAPLDLVETRSKRIVDQCVERSRLLQALQTSSDILLQ